MSKRLLALILSGVLTASLVSCSNKEEKNVQESSKPKVEEKKLEGDWAKDYTKEQLTELNNEVIKKIEELPQLWEIDEKKEETVKDNKGETVKDTNISFENPNPEPNRIESMYYGFKVFGSDMSSGSLEMVMAFNLGREKIKEDNGFDFAQTSLAAFSECFTGVSNRDYSDINSKIDDLVKNNKSEIKIENHVNGLMETITVKDNLLLYKLSTKRYDFKNNK